MFPLSHLRCFSVSTPRNRPDDLLATTPGSAAWRAATLARICRVEGVHGRPD